MKINYGLILGIGYVATLTGLAIIDIGNTITVTHNWSLPVIIVLTYSTPFVFGYYAGMESKK